MRARSDKETDWSGISMCKWETKDCLQLIAMLSFANHLFECWTRFYLVPRVLDKYVKTEYNSMTHAICFACTTNNYIVHVQVKVRDVMSRINFKISRVIFFFWHMCTFTSICILIAVDMLRLHSHLNSLLQMRKTISIKVSTSIEHR